MLASLHLGRQTTCVHQGFTRYQMGVRRHVRWVPITWSTCFATCLVSLVRPLSRSPSIYLSLLVPGETCVVPNSSSNAEKGICMEPDFCTIQNPTPSWWEELIGDVKTPCKSPKVHCCPRLFQPDTKAISFFVDPKTWES